MSPKNKSETNEEEMVIEKYISPELRLKIIDDSKLKEENIWWYKTVGKQYNNITL